MRPTSSLRTLGGLDVEIVTADLGDLDSLVAAARGCDVLFHAAAYYPRSSFGLTRHERHARGEIERVLEAVRRAGVRRLIYTSSLTTIGCPRARSARADERTAARGRTRSSYHRVKQLMEAAVLASAAEGLDAVIVNPTSVVGEYDLKPRQYAAIARIAAGEAWVVIPARMNWIDARDVGRGHVAAALRGRSGERYLLAGESTTFRETVARICRLVSRAPPRIVVPGSLVEAAAWIVEGVCRPLRIAPPFLGTHVRLLRTTCREYDTSKAARELGFQPRPVDDAFERAVRWYRALGYVD